MLLMFSGISQIVSTMLMTWPNAKGMLDWFETHSPDAIVPTRTVPARTAREAQAPIGWKLTAASFRYPSGDTAVIDGLDLTVRPGQTLAVIGPSGAGKSTLLALMLGLLKPTSGQVELVFGEDSATLESRRAELLKGVGYVGPESFLLEGTLRDNLLYGLEGAASASQIDDALDKAECQFVKALPRGLDHILTEQGQGLSAGQKQRLALARALLRRPRVLILDEATANLDLDTESRLADTLSHLKGTMTMVIVTHRTTLLPLADLTLDLGAATAKIVAA